MNKKDNKKINKAGYTLIELMVVVAIIAIFTGLSAVGLSIIQNRNVTKYSKMVNELISNFYNNATTKEGEWKIEMKKLNDNETYQFAQYYKTEENGVSVWKPYYTQSIDGTIVYAVKEIEIDNCECEFYLGNTPVEPTEDDPIKIYVSREHAVFYKPDKDPDTGNALITADTIIFKNGAVSSQLNIVFGTPNNYVGKDRSL